ncbi:MAG: hypothetical protein IJI41_03060 [Anaerolineaceae bacterium]|nr:hypothetical protein [Anaerolineaceae bacterium]
MNQTNTIGKDYTTRELIRFVAPPVLAQFSMSLLSTLDDGLFLSRFVGTNALAAFSIAMPVFMLFMAISELFNGASVLCSTKMGEKKIEEARSHFTTIVLLAGAFGCIVSLFSRIFLDQLIIFLGGTEILFPYVKAFLSIGVWYIPLILINHVFARFYVPAGNSRMSLYVTLVNAFCNFFFDWLFIVQLRLGMTGSAYANLIANIIVFIIGIVFFSRKSSEIHFSKPDTEFFSTLWQSAKFGFPPFLTNVAVAINSYIANQVLLNVGGEESVSAYTIINNIQFMFMSGIWGLTGAVTPIVSYAYGEKNKTKIRKILNQIIALTTGLIGIIILTYFLGKTPLLWLYLKSDASDAVRQMASHGLTIAPMGFLFFGYNVLAIDTLLALHQKKYSTILSILENVICANLTMLTLPYLFGIPGVWFAFPVGEILTFAGTLFFALRIRKMYF